MDLAMDCSFPSLLAPSPCFTLESHHKVNWTAAQEKSIANDYPFDISNETNDQYVIRTYLQFLWLPESIMPLDLLVPSLLRVGATDENPPTPHPLRALLDPLLLTVRSAANKYNVELLRILSDGGGAGDIEETVVWFALNYERAEDDNWKRFNPTAEGPWVNEKWRRMWLDRMEKREVQIQILLYFLTLSLPGPTDTAPPSPSPKKRKRFLNRPGIPKPSLEDRLEAFMDKMSMWQLMAGLSLASTANSAQLRNKNKNNNDADTDDWMQTFYLQVVDPQFRTLIPETCTLLRTKIFPNRPSSTSTSDSPSPSASPHRPHGHQHPRHPLAALPLTTSSARTRTTPRARSLSVTLAQEREMKQEQADRSMPAKKKRVLTREVSMSRVFRPKAGGSDAREATSRKVLIPRSSTARLGHVQDEGITLIAATPIKAKAKLKVKTKARAWSVPKQKPQPDRVALDPGLGANRPRAFEKGETTTQKMTDK